MKNSTHKQNLIFKGFECANCKKFVEASAWGTKNRNHCPYCLCSLHVDVVIGDRKNQCKGVMPAIGKYYKADGEEVLVHKCNKCGDLRKNRVAGDDAIELCNNLPIVEEPK